MKQLKGKENSLYPSRLRGRGAEVSKTLFYLFVKNCRQAVYTFQNHVEMRLRAIFLSKVNFEIFDEVRKPLILRNVVNLS